MLSRIACGLALVASLALGVDSASAATKTPSRTHAKKMVAAKTMTHDGLVVSATSGKLTMTDKGSTKEHVHQVGATAKITMDGKPAKLEDLKKGVAVSVTSDDAGMVVSVAGTSVKSSGKPASTKLSAAQATTAAPTTAPATLKPAAVKPETVKPETVKPAAAAPVAVQPSASKPSVAK